MNIYGSNLMLKINILDSQLIGNQSENPSEKFHLPKYIFINHIKKESYILCHAHLCLPSQGYTVDESDFPTWAVRLENSLVLLLLLFY